MTLTRASLMGTYSPRKNARSSSPVEVLLVLNCDPFRQKLA